MSGEYAVKKRFHVKNVIVTVILTILAILFIAPIFIILMNSFKQRFNISTDPFTFPTGKMFVGFLNYKNGVELINFFKAFGYSLQITVSTVVVILLCTAMCG
jgi:raffinose/stachyose/melibiose transport system permease protein